MIFGFAEPASKPANKPAKASNPDDAEEEVVVVEDDLRDKMRTVMPWVFSFLAHLGVLILASLIAFGIQQAIKKTEVVVPVADMGDEEIAGPLDKPPGPITGEIGPMSDGAPPPPPDAVAPPIPSAPPTPGVSRVVSSTSISSFAAPTSVSAAGAGQSDHGAGIFRGVGGFIGGGGGDGGQRAANRIIFLVDASGSLVDTLPFVLEDLRRMVDTKMNDPKKSFNVIFFSGKTVNREIGVDNKGVSTLFGQLEAATPANRKKAMEWIQKVEAGGSSDPLAAIKKALEMDPDQIHLLSDNITSSGIYEVHQEKFMAEVMKAYDAAMKKRIDPKTKVAFRIAFKTYQFVYKDPMEAIGKEATLRYLVEKTGGIPDGDYRFVTARELGLR